MPSAFNPRAKVSEKPSPSPGREGIPRELQPSREEQLLEQRLDVKVDPQHEERRHQGHAPKRARPDLRRKGYLIQKEALC